MGFNLKQAKVDYEHQDKMLKDKRDQRGHEPPEDGNYERNLNKNRGEETEASTVEQKLSKLHTEDSDKPKVTEARLDDADKRDDTTHKTNTLPINELAEEAQRARLKDRGEKTTDKTHFQKHKQEDLNLSNSNFAKLDGINKQIDELWMASSWNRLTTSEKQKVRSLVASRNKIIRS
jgi:hypothetical protein